MEVPVQSHHELPSTTTRNRRRAPKVRSGCITCKRRHIKCDERKPNCVQCARSLKVCEGYQETPLGMKRMRQVAAPALRPILPCPVYTLGLDERATRYLDLFRYEVARELSVYMFPGFWRQTILRESQHDRTIQLSILALAALSRGTFYEDLTPQDLVSRAPFLQGTHSQPIRNEHQVMAVRYHTEAMARIRHDLTTQDRPRSLRSIVISIALFVTFELLQGNEEAAERMLNNGLIMFQVTKHPSEREQSARDSLIVADTDRELDIMLLYLSDICGSSPFSTPKQNHRWLSVLESLPLADYNIPQSGQIDLEDLLRSWITFSSRCVAFVNQSAAKTSSFDLKAADIGRTQFLPQLHDWQRKIEQCLERELQVQGTHDLQARNQTSQHKSERLDSLRILQVNVVLFVIFFNCFPDKTGVAFDAFTAEFSTVVNLCAEVLENNKINSRIKHFTLDRGVAMLGSVAGQCRDYKVRMKALALYQSISWRECGIYNFQALSMVKKANILLEERSRSVDGSIQDRFVCTKASWSHDERTLVAHFRKLTLNPLESTEVSAFMDMTTKQMKFQHGVAY